MLIIYYHITDMGPKKRIISAEERERRRAYQARYRAQMRQDPDWRAAEVRRTQVNFLNFQNKLLPKQNYFP
jgi:hypothetical protein